MNPLFITVALYLPISVIFILQTECSFFGHQAKIRTDINYLRVCSGVDKEKSKIQLFLNFHKFNRTHYSLSLNATFLEPFDHTYTIEYESLKWGDGGWKRNFLQFKRNDPCRSMSFFAGPVWMTILETAHAKKECPVAKGVYWFDNMFLDINNLQSATTVQPGQFLTFINFTKAGYLATCIEMETIDKQIYDY